MRHLIGTKQFYRTIIALAGPLVLQQLLTSAVQLVDNFMVGRLGEKAMGSVAIVNQLYFIYILVIFGILGGAGVFAAQYYGAKDFDKLKETFRFKLVAAGIVSVIAILIFTVFATPLFSIFSNDTTIIKGSIDYMAIVKFGFLPWAISTAIGSTFRETGITKPLFIISLITILTNTILNYLLIFGMFGFPQLGIIGAAIATVIARVLELVLTFILLLRKGSVFNTQFSKLFSIHKKLLGSIVIMTLPLMLNELLWSSGNTVFFYSYSRRGTDALAAMTITSSVSSLVFIFFGGIATAVAVLVGNTLGKNQLELAKENAKKLITFSVVIALFAGILLFTLSFFIVHIYNVSQTVKDIAQFNIRVQSMLIPIYTFNVCLFFTFRAGGDTKSTFIFDSGFMMLVSVPIALSLSFFTVLPVTTMFLLVQLTELPKLSFGLWRYSKGHWIKNLAIKHATS
jgi:putative MATE family efflux protein